MFAGTLLGGCAVVILVIERNDVVKEILFAKDRKSSTIKVMGNEVTHHCHLLFSLSFGTIKKGKDEVKINLFLEQIQIYLCSY